MAANNKDAEKAEWICDKVDKLARKYRQHENALIFFDAVKCISISFLSEWFDTTVKFLNFRTPTHFIVSTLKFKLSGSTLVFYL